MGRQDLTGMRFGRWTVKERSKAKTAHWVCLCDCGAEKTVDGYSLKIGQTTSCGCYRIEFGRSQPSDNLEGMRFGILTVLRKSDRLTLRKGKSAMRRHWICQCECGNATEVFFGSLKSGDTKSCGCLRVKKTTQRKTRHGHTRSNNGGHSKEYVSWACMICRCHSESGPTRYSNKGITVCDEWRNDFTAFLRHIGPAPSPKHSVDRINNTGNYEPGNVRWATKKEQMRNISTNRVIEFQGESMTIAEWSERTGISQTTLGYRINHGWAPDKALTTPTKKYVT